MRHLQNWARQYGAVVLLMLVVQALAEWVDFLIGREIPAWCRLAAFVAAVLPLSWYMAHLRRTRLALVRAAEQRTADLHAANAALEAEVRQRSAAEQEARQSAHFFDRVINAITDPIFVKDAARRFVTVNDAMCILLGKPRDQLIGRGDSDLAPADQAALYIAADLRVLDSGLEDISEEPITDARGVVRTFVTKKTRYIDEAGTRYLICITRDVTERRETADRIAALNVRLSGELRQNGAMLEALRESENRFRRAIVNAPMPIVIHAEDGEVLELSEAWTRISGYQRAEIPTIAAWLRMAESEDAVAPTEREIKRTFERGCRVDAGEHEIRTKSGARRIWSISAAPLGRLPDGRRTLIATAMDVTELKEVQDRLRYRAAVLDATADMVVITNREGIIRYVNPAFTRGTGYTSEEVVGRKTSMLKSGRQDAAFYRRLWETILAGRAWTGEMMNQRKDGTLYAEEMSITPVLDEHGEIDRFVAIKRDIEERKRAQRIEEERNHLAGAVQGMERVLGVVGHELRTPLASLRAMAELLLTEEIRGTQEATHFIQSIHDESVRMAGMISDLLEVARVNSGAARWNWSRFAVEESCSAAMESLNHILDRDRVALELHVETPGMEMLGDADAVRRLVLNLLTNAAKHTRRGRIEIRVRAAEADGAAWVELDIADTGAGIAPEVAARLGEAFALNSGLVGASHVSGAGLGLAICRGIVAAHGGTVRVQSALGAGTTVSVRLRRDLPAAAAAPAAAIDYQARPAEVRA